MVTVKGGVKGGMWWLRGLSTRWAGRDLSLLRAQTGVGGRWEMGGKEDLAQELKVWSAGCRIGNRGKVMTGKEDGDGCEREVMVDGMDRC